MIVNSSNSHTYEDFHDIQLNILLHSMEIRSTVLVAVPCKPPYEEESLECRLLAEDKTPFQVSVHETPAGCVQRNGRRAAVGMVRLKMLSRRLFASGALRRRDSRLRRGYR